MATSTKKKEDDKKEKAEESEKEAKAKPEKEGKDGKKGFTLSFEMDDNFKAKAPLLVLMLLFFAFAGFMFQNASFHSTDLVDVARIQFNAAKLYSMSFILFSILFSLVLALAMHYGFKQNLLMSLLTFPATLLPAIILGVLYPPYLMAFIAFSIAATAASFFAARIEKLNLSGAYNTASRALLVLAILAFAVTFMKVSADPAYYSETMMNSFTALIPEIGGQAADALKNTQLDESLVKSVISKDTFAKSITTERVQTAIEAIPGITSFNASLRTKWAEAVKNSLVSDAAYAQFVTMATASLQEIKGAVADKLKDTATTDSVAKMAISQVKGSPMFKTFLDALPLILALSVLSIMGIVNFFLKILSALFAWILGKIAFS